MSMMPDSGAWTDQRWKSILRNTAYILLALLVFLLALALMISSLQHLGTSAAETIITATSNPFTGLFIGLLVTAIIQSSSATTSMVVALVTSGAISLEGAVPIIMGANIGTTITSTIVSLGFITKKREFRRAIAAGTYHDFFNILTVLILFPLEYYYGFVSGMSKYVADQFFIQSGITASTGKFSLLGPGIGAFLDRVVLFIDNGFILILLSFALLFGSILFFRKVISDILDLHTESRVQFFFSHPLKAFGWGLLITAAIRSSTITTSLVVPLAAKKMVKLKGVVPFILGSNIGTTVTAFIAAMSNSNIAISIAIAHLLINLIGVLIFFPIPYIKEIPIRLAKGLGGLTIKYRLAGFLYILMAFFFIPFSLIYLSRDSVSIRELTYTKTNGRSPVVEYTMICKNVRNQQLSSWMVYDQVMTEKNHPSQMIRVYRRKNILMINNELFELNKPGFCRDGEDDNGKYRMCIREIIQHITSPIVADSVFVFEKQYLQSGNLQPVLLQISSVSNLLIKKESTDLRGLPEVHQLISVIEK